LKQQELKDQCIIVFKSPTQVNSARYAQKYRNIKTIA